ncbi:MAG: hypothetical protein JWM87_1247 [Candidatus Eremiobacteraeota bacterium]|nr:hypothetical protein [Candidatus Eremiobacteraeota bacterium]
MAWWATPHALVWWAILIALAIVLALAGAQAARALREIKRLNARIEGFADLPVAKALPRVEDSIRRIEDAVDEVEPLIERAKVAIAGIRRGPLPPGLVAGIRRVAAEIAAFRQVARR